MTTGDLVEQVRQGDVAAFEELVTRYQGMAFSYALATVRDYHLAEDATQQALIVAYRSLGTLREPSRFGSWLRGIVRFESLRLLRRRAAQRAESLDSRREFAAEPVDPSVDLEWQAELSIEVLHLMDRMAHLPERQRTVAQLYYLGDRSQGQVAEFLGLSVSAVNNRLREARAILRREGDTEMTKAPMKTLDFAKIVGTVIRAEGLTIDTRFDRTTRPALLSEMSIGDAERSAVAFVSQYLDDDIARLIRIDRQPGEEAIPTGAPVRSDGQLTGVQLGKDEIARLVEQYRSLPPMRIASGIKVIDLFAPLVTGGVVAIVGAMNVGKLVLVEELVSRLGREDQPVTILVFLASPDELGVAHHLDYRIEGSVTVAFVPVADASVQGLASSLEGVESVLVMSRDLGEAHLYPAIDPIVSRGVTADASPIIERARTLLRDGGGPRAALLRAYLTQPFAVAEPVTGRPGVSVARDVAEADLARLVDGDVSALTAGSLTMIGSLADQEAAEKR